MNRVAYPAIWVLVTVKFGPRKGPTGSFRSGASAAVPPPRMASVSPDMVGGTVGRAVQHRAGYDIGTEIDLLLSFRLTNHSNLIASYPKLYRGTFIERSGPAVSPELLLLQYGHHW